ncbi:UNVERIFIED_ORG: hypothetical protein ABIB52_000386 [Arthrobacter sp. UYCu721]
MTDTATMAVVMSPIWVWSLNCTGSWFSRLRTPAAEAHSGSLDFNWMMTGIAPAARICSLYFSSTATKAPGAGAVAVPGED